MNELALLVDVYMRLLALPHTSLSRHRMQSVLASLVHEIAQVSGSSPEHVQTNCEQVASWMRK